MTNAHIGTFDKFTALVSWEETSSPECNSFIAMVCYGTYAGTLFQVIDSAGAPTVSNTIVKAVATSSHDLSSSTGPSFFLFPSGGCHFSLSLRYFPLLDDLIS
jgi:hypothetical protein